MLKADLTDAKAEIKTNGLYANMECIDAVANSITDDDALLCENRKSDYLKVDTSTGMPHDMYSSIKCAVYDKFYLAVVYKILDNYGVSKEAITSFDSHSLNSNYAYLFECFVNSDKITEIHGGDICELGNGYCSIFIEIRRADGGLDGYVTVLPFVFCIN